MDIAHQIQEIGIFLAKDGFVAVLKKMPVASVAAVETAGVTRQQSAHDTGDRDTPGAEQQVKVVGHQGPRIAGRLGFRQDRAQALYKVLPIEIFAKNQSSLDSAADDVVKCSWSIDAGFSWHEISIPLRKRE